MTIQIEKSDGTNLNTAFIQFAGGERHVQLPEMEQSEGRLVIRASLQTSNDIMDLLLVNNALRHKLGRSVPVDLEIPYLPYARQDRVCAPGQAFSLEVMAGLIHGISPSRLVTWDCHSSTGTQLTGATNVNPVAIIKSCGELVNLLKDRDSVLICPDKGAVARCEAITEGLGLAEMVRCEKQRNPATGEIEKTEVLSADLTGKCAVITDDICDGGYTFIKIAEQLRQKNVAKIVLFVTHGIFSKGIDVFDGLIDHIYTTTSFDQCNDHRITPIDYSYNFGEVS